MRDKGFLIELSRRGFRLADAEMSPYLDLFAVSQRSPQGTICLNSNNLIDEVSAEVHRAVPRGAHRPVIDYSPVRVHVFTANTFELRT